jgi:hypothetical protein
MSYDFKTKFKTAPFKGISRKTFHSWDTGDKEGIAAF